MAQAQARKLVQPLLFKLPVKVGQPEDPWIAQLYVHQGDVPAQIATTFVNRYSGWGNATETAIQITKAILEKAQNVNQAVDEAASRVADEERRGVQGGALRPLGRVRERVAELGSRPRPRPVEAIGVRGLLERDWRGRRRRERRWRRKWGAPRRSSGLRRRRCSSDRWWTWNRQRNRDGFF